MRNMTSSTGDDQEKEFRELVSRVLDKLGYLCNDKDPKVTDKEKEVDATAIATSNINVHDHCKEEEKGLDEYLMVVKKSSEEDHKPPALPVFNHHYQRSFTKFEGVAVGKPTSLTMPPKKRLFFEHDQEEGAVHNNKKIMKDKISCCSANPAPELPRKFTYNKNKTWGSAFVHYFVKNNFVEEKPMKKKTNKRISTCDSPPNQHPPLPHKYREKVNAMGGSAFMHCFAKENNFVEEKPKKKTNKRISTRYSPPNQHPPLPHKYREKVNAMGGSEPVLVIQKQLFNSDTTQQLNRLSMPIKQIKDEFLNSLTDEEKGHLKEKEQEVTLIDPHLVEWTLNMAEWNMTSSVFVLIKNWYKLVVKNGLKAGMEVQLWSFRLGTKLCFILVSLDS